MDDDLRVAEQARRALRPAHNQAALITELPSGRYEVNFAQCLGAHTCSCFMTTQRATTAGTTTSSLQEQGSYSQVCVATYTDALSDTDGGE